jgi:hypothetical protein
MVKIKIRIFTSVWVVYSVMRRKLLIDKVAKKHFEGKCHFCDVDDYECLHCHRIVPGEDDGIYSDFNTVVCCANHHAQIHADDPQIVIDRKYLCTNGRWVLHYWENGAEKWL